MTDAGVATLALREKTRVIGGADHLRRNTLLTRVGAFDGRAFLHVRRGAALVSTAWIGCATGAGALGLAALIDALGERQVGAAAVGEAAGLERQFTNAAVAGLIGGQVLDDLDAVDSLRTDAVR